MLYDDSDYDKTSGGGLYPLGNLSRLAHNADGAETLEQTQGSHESVMAPQYMLSCLTALTFP